MASSGEIWKDTGRDRDDMTGTSMGATVLDGQEDVVLPSDAPDFQEAYATKGSLIIDRLMARLPLPRPWVAAAIGTILLIVPLALAYNDGLLSAQLLLPYRSLFVYPFVIVYILLVFDFLEGTRAGVAQSLRPLVEVDDATYADLVARGCRVPPVGELAALGIGLIVSLAITGTVAAPATGAPTLDRYAYFMSKVMLSLDMWFIYVVFAMTKLTNTLLRQPMHVDIFDLSPFERIGHQTVWLCLTFVGSLLFGLLGFDQVNRSLYWASLVFFAMIILFVLAVFYVNTIRVHHVLSAAKGSRLGTVNTRLARASSALVSTPPESPDVSTIAAHINALAVVKQELKQTRTWPYNTEMLRTMVISIVTPLFVGLSRIAAVLLASSPTTGR